MLPVLALLILEFYEELLGEIGISSFPYRILRYHKILENGLIEEYEEQSRLSCLVTQIEVYKAYNRLRLVHPRRQYIKIIQ